MNQKKESTEAAKNLNRVIKIDEARIHSHLDEMIRDTVQETLNKMLDDEADRLCNAQRYEHTEGRTDTRAGSYGRRLHTKAGPVNLKVPRLRKATLEAVIIEHYRRQGGGPCRCESIQESFSHRIWHQPSGLFF